MKKKNNTPRHKRLNQEGRLQAAKHWLVKYNGKNLVRGYSNHFAVDLLCAVRELEKLGIQIDKEYKKQLEIDLQNKIRRTDMKKKKIIENQEIERLLFSEMDEDYEIEEYIELPFGRGDEDGDYYR
ncbi:hypothetical protein U9M73_12930 [Paenibacillus phoenicis]|uniref:Terminase n=1 Tax=Paenibacillus phoenicis TaxID=554117 RepID=A0ABU5PMH1_9BACL|nr:MULTISPECIES: hypothetical protein [Paenibacillus]MEA3570889.1 hypothetical protein [Paenibacillus phoenicis]